MIKRPYKYEVGAKVTEDFDPILNETVQEIIADTPITGDSDLSYNPDTEVMTVWTNKRQYDLLEVS